MTRKVLPSYLVPIHYDLVIYPDIVKHVFYGKVTLTLKSNGPIHLNAKELTILSIHVNNNSCTHTVDQERESIIIDGDFVDTNTVVIEYTGIHNDKMAGFYRSRVECDNYATNMVVTQFEPTDCRKCMPCIDEPAKKATFQVTMICEESLTALCNTSVLSSTPITIDPYIKSIIHISDKAYKSVKFRVTPKMSTYILAMACGDLDYIESSAVPGDNLPPIPVRSYGPRNTKVGNIKQSKFALQVCCDALIKYANYFDMAYPIDKLDLLAVPDFSAGAMENFGLITFRSILLYIDSKSSLSNQQQCAYVVCHELAHQWFGNMVTFEWWDELWLNEGFATFVGWLVTCDLFPKWNVWDKFVSNDYLNGLSLDALLNTHPIQVQCDDPNDIGQIFDAISYSKGATVIKMLYDYYPTLFIKGVANYLKAFQWGNATTLDLWHHVGLSCDLDIASLMKTWTMTSGYPVVKLDIDGPMLKIQQTRFLINNQTINQQWPIPIGLKCYEIREDGIYTSASPLMSVLLLNESDSVTVPSCTELVTKTVDASLIGLRAYKLNFKQSTMMRVQYSTLQPLLKIIKHQLSNNVEVIPVVDRLGVLNDLYNLGVSGSLSIVKYLEALYYFKNETDYHVLLDISKNIKNVSNIFNNKVVESRIDKLISSIYGPVAHELTFEGKDDPLKRQLAIKMAGLAGDAAVVKEAKERFDRFIVGEVDAIDGNVLQGVFMINIMNNGDYKKFKEYYINCTEMDKKLTALGVLGHVQSVDDINDVLNMVFSEHIRPQDLIYVLQGLGNNKLARRMTLDFIKENWDRFSKLLEGSLNMLGNIVSRSCVLFTEAKVALEMEEFFKKQKEWKQINKSVEQTIEKINNNSSWVSRDLDAVLQWAEK
eukprot:NODE_555_length_6746_cov_0.227170.p1 type:complete len:880 gc:universal NODE_555_length_6746_cov_0.227170:3884-6523(+)